MVHSSEINTLAAGLTLKVPGLLFTDFRMRWLGVLNPRRSTMTITSSLVREIDPLKPIVPDSPAVAFLELLAAAAGARIVAPHLCHLPLLGS